MWFKIRVAAATIGAVAFVALVEYIIGRIILPEMSLTAPGYWPWFWVSAIAVAAHLAFKFLEEVLGLSD